MNLRLTWLLVLLLATPVSADTSWSTRDGHYRVRFHSEIDPIVINRIHRWVLEITDADGHAVTGAKISVDGGMPAHDHGLPTRPRVTGEPEPGQYRLEGLRFHMRGQWQIELTIDVQGVRDVAVITLEL